MSKVWAFCIAAALLGGCVRSGDLAEPRPAPPAHRIASAVRFDLAADPGNLNPLFLHQDAASVEQQVARLSFEPFIDFDPAGREIPELLLRVPSQTNGDVSRDGRTIVYRLRPGVYWSDGVAVTSDDVLFTLRAIVDPRNPVRSREGYDRIARADAVDAHTVRITLREPWAPAVATLFGSGTAPQFVLPAHLLEREPRLDRAAFGTHPVGDGPFRFVSWQHGDRLVYAANPQYWRGVPRVQRLVIRVLPDPGTNFTALQSGELDWNLLSPAQWMTVRTRSDLGFRFVPLALVAGIALNTAHPPLDDVRVRRALAAAIDRDAISAKLTFGRYPPIDTAQPLLSWAHDPTARLPRYDPAAADRALDAAGWRRGTNGIRTKGGKRLAFVYVQFPESQTGVRVAAFVERALRVRGVDVTIKSVSNAQLFLPAAQGGVLASGAFDLAYVPWPMGVDPDDSALLGCHGSQNIMRWCDPEVDALEQRALVAPAQDERRRLYAQIEHRVAAAVPIVYLFDPAYVYAVRPRLAGFAPSAFSPTWNASAWSLTP